jgi:cyclic-di-AMP phosphodiesterase PgpH
MGKSKGNREVLQHRSKYIDHSLRFLDWVNGLGFERTRLGRLIQHFDDRFRLRRISLLFLFSLGLSVLMFYDFDFTYSARVGERVTHDIKSPLSIEVVDDVATEEKRKAAENAVPMVFDFDRSSFEDVYAHVYTSFRKMREEMHHVALSGDDFQRFDQIKDLFRLKPDFEKTIGHHVSDQAFEWLISNRFSPRIENMALQTLDLWSQLKIAEGVDQLRSTGQKEIIAREVSRGSSASRVGGREMVLPLRDLHDIGRGEDFPIPHLILSPLATSTDQRLFTEFVHSLVSPNVTLNRQETETRRGKAREEVLPIVIAVKKNQVIVPDGTVVQPIHVTLLNEIENQRSNRNRNFVALVASVMFVVMLLVFFSYLRRFTLNRVRVDGKDIAIMGVVMLVVVTFTKFFIFLTNTAFSSTFGSMIPESAFLFAAPVASGTMLVGLLITSGEVVWLFSLFLAVVLGLMVDAKFSFMLVTVVGSLAAARGVHGCKTRNDLYFAGLRAGLVNAVMVLLVMTVQHFGNESYMRELLWTVPAGLLSGLLSCLVAMMLIPLLESVFNCTTDVKLLELCNLNHPLLREMVVKAPGTYHHSLVVGSMVETAAEEIGANPLLAKVMSYYHDIGKTEHAAYFIENQKAGQNPHDHLSPHMSKTILIAHVKDGVELGVEHKLGKPIIDGIVQHHGTTLIAFFYNRAMEMQNEDIDSVGEADFRYPGPKPQFREAALIMLADSIEAASRSLDEPTPMRLQNIVKNIIQRKFMDAQLDECNLTLKDLSIIEEAFTRILLGIYHQRIDYPRRAGGGASETPRPQGGSLQYPHATSGGGHRSKSTAAAGSSAASTSVANSNVVPGPGVKKQ